MAFAVISILGLIFLYRPSLWKGPLLFLILIPFVIFIVFLCFAFLRKYFFFFPFVLRLHGGCCINHDDSDGWELDILVDRKSVV